MQLLVALLLAGTQTVDVNAAPQAWSDFPVFVWRQRYAGRPLPDVLIEPFRGTNVVRDEDAEWVRAKGLAFYVTSAAGRDDVHVDADEAWTAQVERWKRTGDPAALARVPCLTDPATIRRLDGTLARSVAARGGAHGFGLSLGDEVTLNPSGHPLDLCRSDTCEARWRAFATAHDLPAVAPLTNVVRRDLAAGEFASLGPWLARRRFHRDVIVETVRRLASRAGAHDVGLLGLTASPVFGGIDLGALLAPDLGLDFVELYPALEGRALLAWRSARPRTLATVFVQADAPDGVAWQAWEHWARGGDGLVVWSDQYLEDRPAQRARLAEAVRDIRRVNALVPRVAPMPDARVAVLSDPDSIAASWLRDALLDGPTWTSRFPTYQREFGGYEARVETWLRLVEDHGELPAAIGFAELLTAGADVVILPRVLVVDAGDARLLERFLREQRGVLVVDGELAWVDRRGVPWDGELVERLRAIAPERVLDAPPGMEAYRATRVTNEHGRLHAFLDRALERSPYAGTPALRIRAADGTLPLLITRRNTADATWFTVVPNLPDAEQRGSMLRTARLQIEATDAGEPPTIEWIHPADGDGTLRAGDAAVFRIAR